MFIQRCWLRHKLKTHKQKKKEQKIKIYNAKIQRKKTEVKMILKKIIFSFITIDILLNEVLYAYILIDSKCLCFDMITKKIIKCNKLKQFPVSSWKVINVMSKPSTINKIIKAHININKHMKTCYFCIENNNLKYNLILNRLWLNKNDV